MKIEIIGSGCPKCNKTFENAKQAIANAGIQAELVKVTDIKDIMNYGVMITPALAIDGKLKVSGRIPSADEILNWISEHN
jgi:small redox-active disulfide protein 2